MLARPTAGDELNAALPERFFQSQDAMRAVARQLVETAARRDRPRLSESFAAPHEDVSSVSRLVSMRRIGRELRHHCFTYSLQSRIGVPSAPVQLVVPSTFGYEASPSANCTVKNVPVTS